MWVWFVALAAAVSATLGALRSILGARLRAFAERTQSPLDDVIADLVRGTHPIVIVVTGLGVALEVFYGATPAGEWARLALTWTLVVQAGMWGVGALDTLGERRRRLAAAAGQNPDVTAWSVFTTLVKVSVWMVVGVVALDNAGLNVGALLTGLGIGGIAVGLAVQNVLGDVFAWLAIVLDRPFRDGDFLTVGDESGTVEHVGLKTTRLRSYHGEQIIISNADLLGSRIRNFQSLAQRRVVHRFAVPTDAPTALLASVPSHAREVVASVPRCRFERCLLVAVRPEGLEFELVWVFEGAEFDAHAEAQHLVLIGVVGAFRDTGLGLAVPTRAIVQVPFAGGASGDGAADATLPTVREAAPGPLDA